MWNRIEAMKQSREGIGTPTVIEWVKAHIETEEQRKEREEREKEEQTQEKKEGKKKGAKPPPRCACGAEPGECDPDHRHHRGNEEADRAANEGREMEPSGDLDHDPKYGEDTWHLIVGKLHRGMVCEGDVHTHGNKKGIQRKEAEGHEKCIRKKG